MHRPTIPNIDAAFCGTGKAYMPKRMRGQEEKRTTREEAVTIAALTICVVALTLTLVILTIGLTLR